MLGAGGSTRNTSETKRPHLPDKQVFICAQVGAALPSHVPSTSACNSAQIFGLVARKWSMVCIVAHVVSCPANMMMRQKSCNSSSVMGSPLMPAPMTRDTMSVVCLPPCSISTRLMSMMRLYSRISVARALMAFRSVVNGKFHGMKAARPSQKSVKVASMEWRPQPRLVPSKILSATSKVNALMASFGSKAPLVELLAAHSSRCLRVSSWSTGI
mmetsp:Transcript_39296/g.98891  ORF Transcript_39296/g.98891 Transcript_39296/m.98891 type:complete len:214 (+) Transcript_39296:502-1143(+)